MATAELNKELERYLAERRRGPSIWKRIFGSKEAKPKLAPEIETYEETKQSEEKVPFWKKLFKKNEEEPEVVGFGPSLEEDLKEVASIALKALKHLPPERLITFKSSEDFTRLKEILKRRNLIK